MKKVTPILTIFLLILASLGALLAQERYPNKPIKIIVALGPGTINDIVARIVSESLARDMKAEFIMDYKPGGGGVVGADFVAKSKPDGYTLGSLSSPALTNVPAISPKLGYDPLSDLTPLANVGSNAALVAVNAAAPWMTLEAFLNHARKNPGKVTCGTSGVGTSGHFNLELLQRASGVQITHVPYKGSPPNITALLGGHIDCASQVWSTVVSHVKAEKLRVLAATTAIKDFPQFPTFAQKGFPEVKLEVWWGLFAPANLPKDVFVKLASALEKALKDSEVLAKLEKAGLSISYQASKDFTERIKRELAIVRDVAQKAGIKAE